MTITLKRAYEKPSANDGMRILVERLWPRGVSKEAARIDLWAKDTAPSPELRRWYAHDSEKWPEFKKRYRAELAAQKAGIRVLRDHVRAGPVTFVYASKETERNSASVLREIVLKGV